MMKRLILIASALLILAVSAQVQAQQAQQPSPVTFSGFITTAARQVHNNTNSSKFNEYRDIRNGAYLPGLALNVFHNKGWYFDFAGTTPSLGDQSFAARGGRAGKWNFGFHWFDVPHDLSNKAQTPYNFRGSGLLVVPAHVPITFKKLATAAADTPGVLASDNLIAAYQSSYLKPTELETKTSFGALFAQYGVMQPSSLRIAYDVRNKSGLQPGFGPIGDRPPRTLNIQITEPVDYRTEDLTLSAEHVGRKYTVQFNYVFSDFANRVDTLVWENIYTTAPPDSTFDTWDRAVSVFGRRPLAPDNNYHNASVSAARDMPWNSHLSGTVAFGLLGQNKTLLPYSFHSNALANPTLPRARAEARMNTLQLIAEYVIEPTDRVNVRAWVRHYGLDNDTPQAPWQYATSDASNLNGTVAYVNKRINLAYASNRTNGGVDSTLRLKPWHSRLTVGYEHEAITRKHREADTGENRITASFRARPARWANLRARYAFGDRSGTYNPFVTRDSYWYALSEANDAGNPRFTFDNHPDMRRFDVSDRRRNQGDLTLTLTPVDVFSLAASVRYRGDNFDSDVAPTRPFAGVPTPGFEQDALSPGLQLGFLKYNHLRYSLDGSYTPSERVSFNAFASLDRGISTQRSLEFDENHKQDPSRVASQVLGGWTRGSSQWTANFDDRTWAAAFSTTLTVIPNRFLASAGYTASLGDFRLHYAGYGVTSFDGTPFAPNNQFAFPSRPPDINQKLHVVDVQFEFPVVRSMALRLGYSFERYRTDDWAQGASFPWVEPVGSEFLLRDTSRSNQWGNRLFNLGTYLAPSYNAHVGWVAFSYRF